MSRTNVDIDDELLEQVMRRFRLRTKREAVNYSLRQALGDPMSTEEILAMEGMGWGDGRLELSDLRDDPSRLP
jgi:Arc/MetJ family transcription regulator